MTHKTCFTLLSALSIATAVPCQATDLNTAQIGVSPNFSGGTGRYSDNALQAGTIDLSGFATGGFSTSGSGSVHVEYGLVRLVGQMHGSGATVTRGILRDDITITAPGVPMGTPGTLTYSVTVSGSINSSSGSSYAKWLLQADLGGGAFDMTRSGQFNPPEGSPPGYMGDPFGTYSATINFQFGFAMQLDVEFTGTALAGNTVEASGEADYGGPLAINWGGIADVLANGSPVGSFTTTSTSGTIWSAPINPTPCPGDVNHDGAVDGADLGALLGSWGGNGASDLNSDGVVDGADLGALLGAWGGCPA